MVESAGEFINEILIGLTEKVFFAEIAFTTSLGNSNLLDFSKIYKLVLSFAISIMILKFLKKIFDVYVGWYDGDRDAEPSMLVINFVRAMVVAMSFSFFYGIFVDIMIEFLDGVLTGLVSLGETGNLLEMILNIMSNSLFWSISALVLIICYVILWIKFFTLGIEMMVLRLGFPLACLGLLDSDKGVFAPYLKRLLIIAFTAVIQIFLLRLSILLISTSHLIWGLAMCITAINTPKSLSEFMFAYGGGGGVGRAVGTGYHAASLVKSIKSSVGG